MNIEYQNFIVTIRYELDGKIHKQMSTIPSGTSLRNLDKLRTKFAKYFECKVLSMKVEPNVRFDKVLKDV